MAVEVYMSHGRASSYDYLDLEFFDLASFFSASSHFTIIDSYSVTVGRYKGDPIANSIWTSRLSISENGSWMVVECQTYQVGHGSLPKWQAKIQVQGGGSFVDPSDPTGVKYPKNHGSNSLIASRFAPWGGWDLEDTLPDFNPVAVAHPSSQNHQCNMSPSANEARWFLICDDGWMLRFSRYHVSTFRPCRFGHFIGDVTPVDFTDWPMPRAMLSSGQIHEDFIPNVTGDLLCEGSYLSGSGDYSTTETYKGISFPDHNGNWIQEIFSVPDGSMMPYAERRNPHAGGMEIGFFPYIPIPNTTKGTWFSIPGIRKGRGIGATLIYNKTWMCGADDYTVFFPWDGSTPLY